MKRLIIGSVAASHYFPNFRQPKDIDVLTPAQLTTSDRSICNIESQWHDLAEEIIDSSANKIFADVDILYTLKLSHSYWDIHWSKTIYDIVSFKQNMVCAGTPRQDLHDRLVVMWSKIHGAKKVNMNQNVDVFFNKHVDRIHDHEVVHELVAFNGRPMHEKIRLDLTNTWVDKDLFFSLSHQHQLDVALEEMIVVAIERGKLDVNKPKFAVSSALSKAHKLLITSMTKGWFAQFLVENTLDLTSTVSKTRAMEKIDFALNKLEKRNV